MDVQEAPEEIVKSAPPISAEAQGEGPTLDDAVDGQATQPKGRTSRIASDSLSKRTAAWNRKSTGPFFGADSIKVATPSPWPSDGLNLPFGFRPRQESNAGRLQEDSRRANLPSVLEQAREMQDVEWFPGKVVDPRRLRAMVRQADGEGGSSGQEEDETRGFQVPFRHPNLEVKRYEVLSEESARAFRDSRSSESPHTGIAVPQTSSSAASVGTDPTRSDQNSTDSDTILSRLSGMERFVASFKEVGPRNDAEQGGIRVCMGVPEPKDEVLIPALGSADVPGTGLGQVKEKAHVLNAGGLVYSLAWQPVPAVLSHGSEHLVISAADGVDSRTPLGSTCSKGTPGILQVWSIDPVSSTAPKTAEGKDPKGKQRAVETNPHKDDKADSSVALQMLVYHEYGPALTLEWCPNGHDFRSKWSDDQNRPVRRLGLLAAIFHDGTIRILSIPHPDDIRQRESTILGKPLRVRLEAVLTLEVPNAVPSCLSWAGGELLAAGFSKGHVGVWRTGDLLRSGSRAGRPSHFIPFDDGYITSIAWSLIPYQDASGVYHPESPFLPHLLLTTSNTGFTGFLDLHDPFMGWLGDMIRSRTPLHNVLWSPQIERFVCDYGDGTVRVLSHRFGNYGAMKRLGSARGRVLSMATSPLHSFLAYGATDGCLRVTNIVRSIIKDRTGPDSHPMLKVFRLDHDRSNGKLRMIDNFLPEFTTQLNDDGTRRGGANRSNAQQESIPFHPSIAVRVAAWNPNLGRGHLLASGTGVGIVRIDRFGAGSVKMTGTVLAPEIVTQRKMRAQISASSGENSADTALASNESEVEATELKRPTFYEDLEDDAGSVSFSAIDAQIRADADLDGEAKFEAYLKYARVGALRASGHADKAAELLVSSRKSTSKEKVTTKKLGRPESSLVEDVKEVAGISGTGDTLGEGSSSTITSGAGEILPKTTGSAHTPTPANMVLPGASSSTASGSVTADMQSQTAPSPDKPASGVEWTALSSRAPATNEGDVVEHPSKDEEGEEQEGEGDEEDELSSLSDISSLSSEEPIANEGNANTRVTAGEDDLEDEERDELSSLSELSDEE
ncbi:hypothetical protein A4X13_0g1173 [Tilletia indica]|uniref:Uncharacterized protein n=1 Tax=Tilletia indica TaxID=43049 RepID=A0A177TNW6_9BASI|nr:hypothetical protein A4X13_0g1173 [Tilletia indica]